MRPSVSKFQIGRAAVFSVLLAYLLWAALPMVWLAYSSLKSDELIFRDAFSLPEVDDLRWENYGRAWTEGRFAQYFFNSVAVTGASVFGILILGSMTAYALSRFILPGGRFLFWLFLAGLMIPAQLTIIPLFFQLRDLGLLNSRVGLTLVYIANGLPFAVFVLAGFFRSTPKALYEAAVIDGCGEWDAFRRVMLPLVRPGLVTVGIFQFIGIWKEYFYAFMFLSGAGSEGVRTLPLGLANLAVASQYRTDYGMLFAGLMIVTVPLLIVYVAVQRRLAEGIAAGAIKG
jgi:ABC-type glycerol-3-phosphate transport system permease component